MKTEINLNSLRARKARLAIKIGRNGYRVFLFVSLGLIIIAGILLILNHQSRVGFFSMALGFFCGMLALWYRLDLLDLKPRSQPVQLDDVLQPELLAILKNPLTPKVVWDSIGKIWQARFVIFHLELSSKFLTSSFSNKEADMTVIWQNALKLMDLLGVVELDAGVLASALMLGSPEANDILAKQKLSQEDIVEVCAWLERIQLYEKRPKPSFGGIGRDWASGYALNLERFSHNISRTIEVNGGYSHHLSHIDALDSVVVNLNNNSPVALIGPVGSGKTESIYGLAERLLEGKDSALRYYQIISLNASQIISSSAGNLEKLMLNLFSEAIHAGNLILFLDDAELFFSSGVGAFNMSQLLLPILQNKRLKIIASFTPRTWQQLKANQETLAASFTSITLEEPSQTDVIKILEDASIGIEAKNHLLVTYSGIREAYRLSDQYMQDLAYPGKALKLLEQAVPEAQDLFVTSHSIQTALEKSKGVRISAAEAPEADTLMHLEDRIHDRMINQKRAVNVIAAALRRGRAGVSSPNRPIGSFLFLGPTGVGKTELARSLAAVYFKNENQMIRLDMSEFQLSTDVSRLLQSGSTGDRSLLMSIRENPFSVVLLDEIEKAHPQILNLLLQILDEGQLTDASGKTASFRNSIIIATSNAGSDAIAERVKTKSNIDDFERPLIDKLIKDGLFKPELINRFDEVVLFRPLNIAELSQVAKLMLVGVNKTLSNQNILVNLNDKAIAEIVKAGYDPQFGARPMRRIIQKTVEDAVAMKILAGQATAGSTITFDANDIREQLNKSKAG